MLWHREEKGSFSWEGGGEGEGGVRFLGYCPLRHVDGTAKVQGTQEALEPRMDLPRGAIRHFTGRTFSSRRRVRPGGSSFQPLVAW